ncbi:hypothetical protein GCM10012280_40410 [Wenjunlia tyrosinilytica]|uniref:Uncharacterized protein n=1 Tax=Wenjunlia tyrosinilytica TaxID=1544741 RepID=A0A917ZRX3_9ACTN|nr:hypothetical protein GCM10012280_40410 [Wenjunlia tyrosinilytica]
MEASASAFWPLSANTRMSKTAQPFPQGMPLGQLTQLAEHRGVLTQFGTQGEPPLQGQSRRSDSRALSASKPGPLRPAMGRSPQGKRPTQQVPRLPRAARCRGGIRGGHIPPEPLGIHRVRR